ncbi:MAG: hypothetical protein LCH54_00435 [Bacteroidetes bacterium]|nr:hypothetical protein [Bacteroidota bacterium]
MIIKFILTLFFPVLLFTGLSCNSPTEPKDNPGPDTTSHNFVWRVDTIGYYQSLVRDVAVISENDIWAVGTFYKKHQTQDSTENDRYGICKWDGIKWNYLKVPYRFNGVEEPNSNVQFAAIFPLKSGVIWLSSVGRTPIRYKNGIFDSYTTTDVTTDRNYIKKIWGSDENNVWFVGEKGLILYYNGSTFTKIPYSDEYDFIDVWGDETGVVRAVAREQSGYSSFLVKIENGRPKNEIIGSGKPEDSIVPDIFHSVWWKTDGSFYWNASSNGVYINEKGNYKKIINHYTFTPWIGTLVVRGCAENDVFLVGIHGQVIHYNGRTIHFYPELYTPYLQFNALCLNQYVVCTGGRFEGMAVTLIGKRVN